MKLIRMLLLFLHGLTGLGALAGGYACIVDPVSPLGAPASLLQGSPFDSFLVPGLVLFVLFGIGNLLGLFFLVRSFRWYGYAGFVLGAGMMIWIFVQVMIIDALETLHVVFFLVGVFQAIGSYGMLSRARMFPTGMIDHVLRRRRP